MRRQYKGRSVVQQLEDMVQRCHDLDIWIQIDNLCMPACQEMLKHERLDRRIELHDPVSKGKLSKVRYAQRVGGNHLEVARVQALVRQFLVCQTQVYVSLRMVHACALQQHMRHREVIVRADGKNRARMRLGHLGCNCRKKPN